MPALLLQPHGVEGFRPRQVCTNLNGFTASHGPDLRLLQVEFLAASSKATTQPRDGNHVISAVDDLIDIDVEVVEGFYPFLSEARYALAALAYSGVGQIPASVPLEVLLEDLAQVQLALVAAPLVRCQHGLYVLLRNTRSPARKLRVFIRRG